MPGLWWRRRLQTFGSDRRSPLSAHPYSAAGMEVCQGRRARLRDFLRRVCTRRRGAVGGPGPAPKIAPEAFDVRIATRRAGLRPGPNRRGSSRTNRRREAEARRRPRPAVWHFLHPECEVSPGAPRSRRQPSCVCNPRARRRGTRYRHQPATRRRQQAHVRAARPLHSVHNRRGRLPRRIGPIRLLRGRYRHPGATGHVDRRGGPAVERIRRRSARGVVASRWLGRWRAARHEPRTHPRRE